MARLEWIQSRFIAVLNAGPEALDHDLFDGPLDRIMLGLKAHANTISHARLVALEQSFPLTRAELGEERFHQHARDFAERAEARACDSNGIGASFPAFLRATNEKAAIADLAAIEWAWLESYHAAEGQALTPPDLAALGQQQLLSLRVEPHPSARSVGLTAPLSDALAGISAILPDPQAILISRPEAEVRLVPLDSGTTALFAAAKNGTSVGNLLALSAELPGINDPSVRIMALVHAGALMEAKHGQVYPALRPGNGLGFGPMG